GTQPWIPESAVYRRDPLISIFMCKPQFPHLIENLVAGCVALIGIAVPSAYTQQKTKPADQLYIEVSAVGSNDYFYDHKMGLREPGKAMGVKTEYVGPADFEMSSMITAFEQSIARKPAEIVVVGFEPSLSAIVDKAVEVGIPVGTVDAMYGERSNA